MAKQSQPNASTFSELKRKRESCATCKYKKEIKFMQYCTKLDKYVKDYNICAHHKRTRLYK